MYKTAGFKSVDIPLRRMNDQTTLNKQPRVSQAPIRDHRTKNLLLADKHWNQPRLAKRDSSETNFIKCCREPNSLNANYNNNMNKDL